jgi:hypothetical protein
MEPTGHRRFSRQCYPARERIAGAVGFSVGIGRARDRPPMAAIRPRKGSRAEIQRFLTNPPRHLGAFLTARLALVCRVMSDQPENPEAQQTVELANKIIDLANQSLADGMGPNVIGSGLRHAAANFSAFVYHRSGGGGDEALNAIVEDFLQPFEYYLSRHAPEQQPESGGGGLNDLIEQAKREI